MALLTIPGRARDPARLGLLLILAVGCAAPSLSDPTTPGEVARPSREGRPIGRSDHPRAGKITYRLLAVRATPKKYQVVADATPKRAVGGPLLKQPAWSAPALAHGRLYARGKDRLVCFDLRPAE